MGRYNLIVTPIFFNLRQRLCLIERYMRLCGTTQESSCNGNVRLLSTVSLVSRLCALTSRWWRHGQIPSRTWNRINVHQCQIEPSLPMPDVETPYKKTHSLAQSRVWDCGTHFCEHDISDASLTLPAHHKTTVDDESWHICSPWRHHSPRKGNTRRPEHDILYSPDAEDWKFRPFLLG